MLAGFPTAWFAPNYKYLTETWRDFLKVLKPIIRSRNKSERRIELMTGGSIQFWTLDDPDAGRSHKYKRVVIDEAAKARHLEKGWLESIRPTLTDLKGDADFYSTPKGRNFFWSLFCMGLDPLEPEYSAWTFPTVSNPYIDPAEVEAARVQMPQSSFEQEYLAVFSEEHAGVFRNVRSSIDTGRNREEAPIPKVHYTTGVDCARVADFTVLSTLMPGHTIKQVRHERFNEISWERQANAVRDCQAKWRGGVLLETNGVGDPFFEMLTKLHVPVTPWTSSNSAKTALINHLAIGLERGQFRLMDVDVQTNELLAFEYQLSPSRNVIMSAPKGMHDDCVMSLALSYWGASNPNRLTFR
jgi:hypothetical protein